MMSVPTSVDEDVPQRALRRRAAVAVSASNLLEWYDFAVYAALASVLGGLFFPDADPLAALLASFSVFAVGYAARPVGAFLFGRLADRRGRKLTLIVLVTMMGAATVLIGLIPTYARIGVVAPVLLVVARLVQGLSVGGQFSTAASFLVEIATARRRGLYGAFAYLTANLGFAVGLVVVFILNLTLSEQAVNSWAWRIPFLLSFPLLLLGMYLRTHTTETPKFQALARQNAAGAASGETSTAAEATGVQWGGVVKLLGIGIAFAVSAYIVLSFVLSFLLEIRGLPTTASYLSVLIAIVIGALATPMFGALSDRVGRKPLLVSACLGLIVLSFPAFLLLEHGGIIAVTVGQLIIWIPVAIFCGVCPSTFAELFPTRQRARGVGIPYALVVALFSGTAALVSTWLIDITGSLTAPAWYLIAAAVVSTPFALALKETARSELRSN